MASGSPRGSRPTLGCWEGGLWGGGGGPRREEALACEAQPWAGEMSGSRVPETQARVCPSQAVGWGPLSP